MSLEHLASTTRGEAMKLNPCLCYCAKCGAESGEPCITKNGNRTNFHRARITFERSSRQHRRSTQLQCWRAGWNLGVSGFSMSVVKVGKQSTSYLAPDDYLKGWLAGQKARTAAMKKARRYYMKGA